MRVPQTPDPGTLTAAVSWLAMPAVGVPTTITFTPLLMLSKYSIHSAGTCRVKVPDDVNDNTAPAVLYGTSAIGPRLMLRVVAC